MPTIGELVDERTEREYGKGSFGLGVKALLFSTLSTGIKTNTFLRV